MDDFFKKAAIFYSSQLRDLLYINQLQNTINQVIELFREKNIELTGEIKAEILEWAQYVNGGMLAKYLYRRRNGMEPPNPLRRLLEENEPKESD